MIRLTTTNNIHTITMNDGENAIDIEFIRIFNQALDAVESKGGESGALVITGTDKIFSTGLKVQAVMGYDASELDLFTSELKRMFGRLLNFPLPTIAAINGHAFAGGAFLALACDYRTMREDRGWFSINEIDVGVPIGPEIMGIAQAKLTPTVLRDAVLMAKRYGGDECERIGIVDKACHKDALLDSSVEMITELASKERNIFTAMKSTLYVDYTTRLGVSCEIAELCSQ